MLKFVIGEKGSGKTEYCIKKAVESGRAIIIVPERLSHSAEAALAKRLGVFGLGSVEVLSFGQMAKRALMLSDGAALRHIDKAGKVMILFKIITESSEFELLKGNEEEKAVCVMRLISEFKRYTISPEEIEKAAKKTEDKALSSKLYEIASAYKKFEENINGKFINADDDALRFAASDYAKEKYKEYDIFIDSFTGFTGSEIRCIEMFMKNSKSVTVTLCMDFEKRKEIRFFDCNRTYERLIKCANEAGVLVKNPEMLKPISKKTGEMAYLADNYFVPGAKAYEKECSEIECFAGKNMISEVENAAAKIRETAMQEGFMYHDFAVICSDMATYGEYIKSIFGKYDIKVFPDTKTNISNHPVASFIKGALDVIVKGFTYSNIFRLVKYGFLDISYEESDKAENFALASGARGSVWSSEEKFAEFTRSFYEDGEEAEEIISACKKIILPLNKLKSEMGKATTAADKCRVLYGFLEEINVPEKLFETAEYFSSEGDEYSALEYKSVYNKIIDVLDEICSAIGDDRISNAKFADVLMTGISQFEIGKIPALCDGVLCGGMDSVHELSAKVIFVLGMNEGAFPAAINKTGFLNDFDRQRLAENGITLAADASTKAKEGEYLLYRLFGAAEKKLYFSYATSTIEGAALRQAWALQKIKALFPLMKCTDDLMGKDIKTALGAPKAAFSNMVSYMTSEENLSEAYSTAYRYFKESDAFKERLKKAEDGFNYKNDTTKLGDEVLKKLYGDEMVTAVSRLEKYSACPFSYFMRYVLGAQARQIFKFQPKDAGVFLHAIAEEFSKKLEAEGKTWAEVDKEYIKYAVRSLLSEDGSLLRLVQMRGKRGERFFARLCAVAEYAISVITEHIQRGKFMPMGYEIKFSKTGKISPVTINMPDGKKVTLTGVIDRLDVLQSEEGTYFRIIDYKTGSKSFDLGEIYHGITLQLAVYMCAAANMKGGGKPAGMLYFKFANPDVRTDPYLDDKAIEEKKMKALSLSGLLVSTEHVLNSMDVSEEFDFLPVKKKKDGTFSGSIATEQNFEDLRRYVTKTVKKLAEGIFSGNTDISPYRIKDATPCSYCEYSDACNFDAALGCRSRFISKLDNDEIWEKMNS